MQKEFDILIDSYIENKIGIAEGFLTDELAGHLRDNLNGLFSEQRLLSAGTGNDVTVSHDKLIRGDKIYWLDRIHENCYENEFFDLIDSFVRHLNATCYTGITGYEFHYTLYEKERFYKKHLDQFRNSSSRQYSMIMYLNQHWVEPDGGELQIHQNGLTEKISPSDGKCVFFKSSELEHEVLVTNKARLSITGWLKIG